MSIFFNALASSEASGLLCAICRKSDKETVMQNMKITGADGETTEFEIIVAVHYSCLMNAGNEARVRHVRKNRK